MSQTVRLASEIDFAGWRTAARTLRAARAAPDAVIWTVDGSGDLFDDAAVEARAADAAFCVPREFMTLAATAILHRSDERFALLYRVLWRLAREPCLLKISGDPDSDQLRGFAGAVAMAGQKLRTFADFRPVAGAPDIHLAWFEPAHRVTEATAPFFARRFAGQRFSLLTPDACAHWDGRSLRFTPGADPADAPAQGAVEAWWRARYPDLLEAPQSREARNPPAQPPILQPVPREAPAMAAPQPSRRVLRAAQRASRDAPYEGVAATSLEEVRAGVMMCRRCGLYRDAIQGVAGEGPARARLMLVGEQPGDQEDLAGRPFVGPAGQVLDKALAQAGVPRDQVYVTNAVKHFKHELRGKKRIHKTPAVGEVAACRWWLDNERRIVRPRVILALGATAALAVFGKAVPIGASRRQALPLSDQARGAVTWHPSYLLRTPDPDAKARAYGEFVEDLKFAWTLAA